MLPSASRPSSLALIGQALRPVAATLRVDTFAKFQELCGELESAAPGTYWVAHAACHAFMNGMERVILAPADPSAPEQVQRALRALLPQRPELIAMPGDHPTHDRLVTTLQDWRREQGLDPRDFPWLLLDAPPQASLSALCAEHDPDTHPPPPPWLHRVWPWVSTLSPGRRGEERLPGTCVAAALLRGTTHRLRGVHEIPVRPSHADLARARAAGIDVLGVFGQRRLVGLHHGPPKSAPPATDDASQAHAGATALAPPGIAPLPAVEAPWAERLNLALNDACQEEIRRHANGPRLWKTLERRCRAILQGYQQATHITRFHVRCDEETASWGYGQPVVEILLWLPQRVQHLHFRVMPR